MGHLRQLVLVSCLVWASAAQRACYGTHGTPSSNNNGYACDSGAGVSACCAPGDICFDNGFCARGPEVEYTGPQYTPYYVIGCTDATLGSAICGGSRFCAQFDGGNTYGVTPCESLGSNVYCCYGYTGCNCQSGDPRVFTIGAAAPRAVTTLPLSISYTTTTTTTTTTITTTTTTTSTTTTTTTTTGSTTAGTSSSGTSSRPFSSSSSTSTATSASVSEAGSSSKNSLALGLGLGLGLGIPVLLLIIAGVILWVRRRSKVNAAGHANEPSWSTQEKQY